MVMKISAELRKEKYTVQLERNAIAFFKDRTESRQL